MANDSKDPNAYGIINLTAKRFGRWRVLHYVGESYWFCVCDCGTQRSVVGTTLRKGISTSCGCYASEHKSARSRIDISGERFGRLTIISRGRKLKKGYLWDCICDCGNKKSVRLDNLRNGSSLSCGCLLKDFHADRVGSKHPNWNDKLSEEDRIKQRLIFGLAEWRQAVYARDDFTCQVCGIRGKKLNAHHLNGYHWDITGRLSLDNGITLCHKHHREYHSRFGKDNSTREQFDEYKRLKIAEATSFLHGAKLREKRQSA